MVDARFGLTGYDHAPQGAAFKAAGGGDIAAPLTALSLGGFITLLGAKWVEARGRLLRSLPDFPGKDRLPPY